MEVRIKNHLVSETIDFLYGLKLTNGRESRLRSRFVRKNLSKHLEEIQEQQKELLKQHCHLDEEGNPKTINDGRDYDLKDEDAFNKDWLELMNEEYVVDDKDSELTLKTIRKILDNYDGEVNGDGKLSGRKAVLYEHLCEIFKVDEEIEGDS